MKIFENRDWGLKLLALILAIVIYHVLKNDSPDNPIKFKHEGQKSIHQPGR